MTPRYQVAISNKEARTFLRLHFADARIPHGSHCVWMAGVRWITDQPGLYLVSGVGGLEGVLVIPPAAAAVGERAG